MPALPDNNTETYPETLENQYQNLKNLVFKYEEAIDALLSGKHQSYQLDTGQSMQRVTRFDIKNLQDMRDVAAIRLATLALRLRKTLGTKQVVPGW